MRILFIGDIVGKAGRQAVEGLLERCVADHQIDFTVANGENAAGGMGITPVIASEFLDLGIDVLTSGNHIWAKKEIMPFLDEEETALETGELSGPGAGKRGRHLSFWQRKKDWSPEYRGKGLYEKS